MSGKPRVMHMIARMIPGGAQEVVTMIVQRLVNEGYEVFFAYGPGDEGFLKQLPDKPNLTLCHIPEFRRRILPIHDVITFFKLWRFMAKHNIDIAHTHTSKAGLVGRWAAMAAHVPVIIHHPRGSIYHESYFPNWILRFFAFLESLTARYTDKIITLSESEKNDAVRFKIAKPEKFITIYSGVKVSRFVDVRIDADQKKIELGLPLNKPLIGYVARLSPEKGHALCLKMFASVLKRVPDAVLVLVGKGPMESKIRRQIADMKLDDQVKMVGLKWDIPEIISIFDCCVQTSLWDGLPRAMIESMLGEKPVVATKVGGVPEIVEDGVTGILVPENDEDALAEGVLRILKDPEMGMRMGRAARKKLESIIDFELSIKKIMALYQELFESKVTK